VKIVQDSNQVNENTTYQKFPT